MVVVDVTTRRCALDLQHVREVLSLGPLTPVPAIPAAVAGAVNVHGHVTAVIDLGLLIDGTPGEPRQGDASVLVEVGGYTVVLYVKRIHEVTLVDVGSAVPADAGAPVVQGVVSTELGPLHLIDLSAALQQLTAQIAGRSRGLFGTATTGRDSEP